MPMTLPTVDDRPLARSPLAVVVFQIGFEQNLSVGDGDTGLRVHEQLGGRDGRYTRVEPVQMVNAGVQITPAGVTQAPTNLPSRGFRMRNEDGTLSLSLMPEFSSLETSAYGSWKGDFRDRIVEFLNAVNDNVKPRVEERLALRYVNRIAEADVSTPSDFQGIVSDGLLGAAADRFWSSGITGVQQQLEMEVDDDIRCVLRHGTLPRNNGIGIDGYLLDIDVFRAQSRRFNISNIVESIDVLNKAATTIFQQSLTESYLGCLREVPTP